MKYSSLATCPLLTESKYVISVLTSDSLYDFGITAFPDLEIVRIGLVDPKMSYFVLKKASELRLYLVSLSAIFTVWKLENA